MWWEKRKKFWKAGLAKKNRKTYYEKRNNYFKLGYWIFICAVLLTGCSKEHSTEERIVVEDVKEEMEEEKKSGRKWVVDAWFTEFAETAEGNLYFCVRLGRTDGMNVSSPLAKEIAIHIVSDYSNHLPECMLAAVSD